MNHCGINSTLTSCMRACVVTFCYACHLVFWVGLLHIPRVSMGVTLLDFFLVGQLQLGKIIFGPLPHPKIYHRDYIERIPLMLK